MHSAAALTILVLSDLCLAIRVPTVWDSVVQHVQPLTNSAKQQAIPAEYFVYTAEKPQFAVDIAAFHGVQSPENHYKAYPIRPYTGKEKPQLGKHKIQDENREVFHPFQDYTKKTEALKSPSAPLAVDYEVFHPYKAEEPALQQIYKDPVLSKIRDDIRYSQQRLQKYENEAGKPDIKEDEYLESPEQTDRKKFPHRNVPAPYEIHRPQRRPVYYRPVKLQSYREPILNHRFKHPWNQNYAKIRPVNYRPLKNHIGLLRQHHALKYDDERNEYPQLPPPQAYSDPVDGYDIYERGKENYVNLRNNVDESINKAVQENRPTVFQKLELQNNGDRTETQITDNDDEDEEEFIPVKNYAQVRKIETTKHLPREAAFDDAENFDEIRNAPRLREAIKSTKAQTVYTEEGYEDAAYDHAGEQKHASENEGHAGYLKEKEISGGKYKAPSLTAAYEDSNGNEYRDQTLHGEKWKNSDKEKEEEADTEDFSEDDNEHSIEADIYEDITGERNKRQDAAGDSTEVEQTNENNSKDDDSAEKDAERSKRENDSDDEQDTINDDNQHDVNKRETKFKVPEINLTSTFLNEDEITKISKLRVEPKQDDIKDKYPYYFKNLKRIHKHSPLRYAENLKLMPKKSKGGTEFYDSRSQFQCPEVDDKVDALPEKLKKNGHPDDNDDDEDQPKKKGEADFDNIKENPRLKGLGDKIDCFKAKYFGENPLDSPFFKEDIISNPEPVTAPNSEAYRLNKKEPSAQQTILKVFNISDNLRENSKSDVFVLLDKLRDGQKNLQESLVKTNEELRSSLLPQNISVINNTQTSIQTDVYTDVLNNLKNILQTPVTSSTLLNPIANLTALEKLSYNFFNSKQDVTQLPPSVRRRRATQFVYEPYKIIRDGQIQDSKKTTTTSNISPLIRQLQSSKVVDRVTNSSPDKEQPVKRNVATRTYKDIGKKDREKPTEKGSKPRTSPSTHSFVDVSVDKRRGEPRYELRPANHKSRYTPVEDKKSMTLEEYKAQANKTESITERTEVNNTSSVKDESKIQPQIRSRQRSKERKRTVKPYFDVSQFLPKSDEVQRSAASNKVTKVIKPTKNISEQETKRAPAQFKSQKSDVNSENEEDYEEYDDEEETITTTTTTHKPSFRRRRTRPTTTTTTAKPQQEEEIEPELPKLRLVTRFRNSSPSRRSEKKEETTEKPKAQIVDETHNIAPKYREKKKKSSKSTLVTDTKTYNDGDADGDEEDDLRKEEVDALIGITQDMDEYTPLYEKEAEKRKQKERESSGSSEEDSEEYDDDDEYDSDEEDDEEDDEDIEESEPLTTTPEPTKRTLARTTEAPVSTTEARSAKLELRPVVMKKKIEIHKELPVNKSSPHITQFKQDIKEVEIVKETPSKPIQRKLQKNLEALELFKDENLAKDINKLGGVEVFKQNLDLNGGPKHGGNYRSAKLLDLQEDVSSTSKPLHGGNLKIAKEDAETSQSETTKLVELGDVIPKRRMHGGNLKSISDAQRSRNAGRNAKLELGDTREKVSSRRMHGGNFRSINDKDRRREGSKSAKLIEFDDERDDDDESTSRMHGGNFKSYGNSRDDDHTLHGGNYRSAKIIQADETNTDDTQKNEKGDTNDRSKAAILLNSYAQAAPILTTTPAYILDPSKRMYYYVDD